VLADVYDIDDVDYIYWVELKYNHNSLLEFDINIVLKHSTGIE